MPDRSPYPRPLVTVVLASSIDGKIADKSRAAARFGSPTDRHHLEQRIAESDAALFGATTLRTYGTSLSVRHPDLLEQRRQQGKELQPAQIVCSRSGNLDPQLPFFRQSFPHWLLTTQSGAQPWQGRTEFEHVLIATSNRGDIDWQQACLQLINLGIDRLAVLGGGTLVGALFAQQLVDELWLTLCPIVLGGVDAPTSVEGNGFLAAIAPRLGLVKVQPQGDEVFIHYRVQLGGESRR